MIRLSPRDVICIDEAGQVGTRRWGRLATAIGNEPTVVALGDHAQLTPIEAGGLWPILSRDGPSLTEVFRTRLAWELQAWTHLRRAEASDALRLYARHGHLEISETRSQAIRAAVTAWEKDGRKGLLVTDASNAERYRLNREAQGRRWAAGELGRTVVTVTTEHGEIGFRTGDRVQFVGMLRQPEGRRIENRTTGTVHGVDPATRTVVVRTNERHAARRHGERRRVPRTRPPLRDARPHRAGDDGRPDVRRARGVADAQGVDVRRVLAVAAGDADLPRPGDAGAARRRGRHRGGGAPGQPEQGEASGDLVPDSRSNGTRRGAPAPPAPPVDAATAAPASGPPPSAAQAAGHSAGSGSSRRWRTSRRAMRMTLLLLGLLPGVRRVRPRSSRAPRAEGAGSRVGKCQELAPQTLAELHGLPPAARAEYWNEFTQWLFDWFIPTHAFEWPRAGISTRTAARVPVAGLRAAARGSRRHAPPRVRVGHAAFGAVRRRRAVTRAAAVGRARGPDRDPGAADRQNAATTVTRIPRWPRAGTGRATAGATAPPHDRDRRRAAAFPGRRTLACRRRVRRQRDRVAVA